MLVPPQITSGANIPQGTDYVCLKGGRPYRWLGDPVPRWTLKNRQWELILDELADATLDGTRKAYLA